MIDVKRWSGVSNSQFSRMILGGEAEQDGSVRIRGGSDDQNGREKLRYTCKYKTSAASYIDADGSGTARVYAYRYVRGHRLREFSALREIKHRRHLQLPADIRDATGTATGGLVEV